MSTWAHTLRRRAGKIDLGGHAVRQGDIHLDAVVLDDAPPDGDAAERCVEAEDRLVVAALAG